MFDEAGLPIVTPSATNPGLADERLDDLPPCAGQRRRAGPGVATYITDTLGAKTVFVIDDASEYGKGLADIVRESLGDKVVGTDTDRSPARPTSPRPSTAVKRCQPDTVFFGGYYAEAGLLTSSSVTPASTGTVRLRRRCRRTPATSRPPVPPPPRARSSPARALRSTDRGVPSSPRTTRRSSARTPGTYSAEAYDARRHLPAGIAAGNTNRELAERVRRATIDVHGHHQADRVRRQRRGRPVDVYV